MKSRRVKKDNPHPPHGENECLNPQFVFCYLIEAYLNRKKPMLMQAERCLLQFPLVHCRQQPA